MSNEIQFDLNDLVSTEDIENAKQAGQEMREYEQEVEWRREHDPNFEKWYAEECRKTRADLDAITIHLTAEELYEKHRQYSGS